MVGPGDETGPGAASEGPLPATQAGRDQVIAALKTAFVQGRLSKDEFELRLGQALTIYAQLDALTADIPATAPAVAPGPEPSREAANKKMIQQGTGPRGRRPATLAPRYRVRTRRIPCKRDDGACAAWRPRLPSPCSP